MKTAKAALLVSLSLVLAFGLMMVGGCSSSSGDNGGTTTPPPTVTLTSIAVTPGTASLGSSGKTQQFTATGTYSDASTKDLTTTAAWSSSNTATATIGAATGLATSVAAGDGDDHGHVRRQIGHCYTDRGPDLCRHCVHGV